MIVTVGGIKGGVGKSTLSMALACEWHHRGKRVLLVDTDPQGTVLTFGAVAAELENEAPTVIQMGPGLHRSGQLPALAPAYDITVVDTPPRHGDLQRAAMAIADVVLLPSGPSAPDAWALSETVEIVRQAQMLRPGLKAAIVITRKVSRTVVGQEARVTLGATGIPVLESELGFRVAYQEAPAAGLGVSRYDRGRAAGEVRALVDEVEALAAIDD